jgi:8-oxo-dGTP diphosphatase
MGGKWEFPGGKVESGESDSQALIREYLEEFNVPVRVGKLLASAQFEHRQNLHSLRAYEVFLESQDFTLTEHTEWRWIPFRDLETLEFADSDKKLFKALAPYF